MQTVTPAKIAAVMALIPAPHSSSELSDMVRPRLPKLALRLSVARVGRSADKRKKILHSIIAGATHKRRSARLTLSESERVDRLARVFAAAQCVRDGEVDAWEILHARHSVAG